MIFGDKSSAPQTEFHNDFKIVTCSSLSTGFRCNIFKHAFLSIGLEKC